MYPWAKNLFNLKVLLVGAGGRDDEKGGGSGSNLDLEVGTPIIDLEFVKNSFTKDKISLHQRLLRKILIFRKVTSELLMLSAAMRLD